MGFRGINGCPPLRGSSQSAQSQIKSAMGQIALLRNVRLLKLWSDELWIRQLPCVPLTGPGSRLRPEPLRVSALPGNDLASPPFGPDAYAPGGAARSRLQQTGAPPPLCWGPVNGLAARCVAIRHAGLSFRARNTAFGPPTPSTRPVPPSACTRSPWGPQPPYPPRQHHQDNKKYLQKVHQIARNPGYNVGMQSAPIAPEPVGYRMAQPGRSHGEI